MHARSDRPAYLYSAVAGAGLWIISGIITHQDAAWESTLYWRVAYPVLALLLVLITWSAPRHPWRWPIVAIFAQALSLIVANRGGVDLLDLMLFGGITIPLLVVALITGLIARKRRG